MHVDFIMIIWYFSSVTGGGIRWTVSFTMLMPAFEKEACSHWFLELICVRPSKASGLDPVLLCLSTPGLSFGWRRKQGPKKISWHTKLLPFLCFSFSLLFLRSLMSPFTDIVMVMRCEKKRQQSGAGKGGRGKRKKKKEKREGEKNKNAGEEWVRQISASLVLQCIRTGITVATAAPARPLTEKNYKYYHPDH